MNSIKNLNVRKTDIYNEENIFERRIVLCRSKPAMVRSKIIFSIISGNEVNSSSLLPELFHDPSLEELYGNQGHKSSYDQ